MSQQFQIGDLVKLNSTGAEGTIKGVDAAGKYVWVRLDGTTTEVYTMIGDVTLVRSAEQGEPSHPSKIET